MKIRTDRSGHLGNTVLLTVLGYFALLLFLGGLAFFLGPVSGGPVFLIDGGIRLLGLAAIAAGVFVGGMAGLALWWRRRHPL